MIKWEVKEEVKPASRQEVKHFVQDNRLLMIRLAK